MRAADVGRALWTTVSLHRLSGRCDGTVFFYLGGARMKRDAASENDLSKNTTADAKEGKASTLASPSRRRVLQSAGYVGGATLLGMLAPGVRESAWAAGSDAPEKPEVKI